MIDQPHASRETADLQTEIHRLRSQLRDLQHFRDRALRRRRRRILSVGLTLSVILHVGLLVYFGLQQRAGAGDGGPERDSYEFALVFDEQLTDEDELTDELTVDEALDVSEIALDDAQLSLDAVDITADLAGGVGELPSLGGAGDGGGDGGLGGGGGTSYFGITAQGNRIAYIVDRSGSMGVRNRMEIATRELIRSIESLPDYAHFHIVMFSSGPLVEPPMQRGWTQARRANVNQHIRWLEDQTPGGGTVPAPAFDQVMNLNPRPDVIYFMTDGIIVGFTAEEIKQLNSRGKRVIINTIAFGDQGSEDLLREIARDSNGQYRYVSDGGL